jgi:RNA polymerase sigma-70 factor (TIGR02943 family)
VVSEELVPYDGINQIRFKGYFSVIRMTLPEYNQIYGIKIIISQLTAILSGIVYLMSIKQLFMLNPADWVKQYADYLLNYAYLRVRNRELAEDLMQETFISALKSQHTYNGTASEKTWLTAILKYKIIDHYRSKLSKQSKLTDSIDQDANNDFFNSGDTFHWFESRKPKDWNTADKILESREFDTALSRCLEKMPERLSAVFSLKYIAGETTESVCKEFGITSSNYWIIIHRAKLQLRECLEKNWFKA